MFCQNCGAKLPDDSQFCSTCGGQIATSSPSNTTQQSPQSSAVQNTVQNKPPAPLPDRLEGNDFTPSWIKPVAIIAVVISAIGILGSYWAEPFIFLPLLDFIFGALCYGYLRIHWHTVSNRYAEKTKFTLSVPMTEQELLQALQQGGFTMPGLTDMGINQKNEIFFTVNGTPYYIHIKNTFVRISIPIKSVFRDKNYFPKMRTAGELAQHINCFFDPYVEITVANEHYRLFALRKLAKITTAAGLVGLIAIVLIANGPSLEADTSSTQSVASSATTSAASLPDNSASTAIVSTNESLYYTADFAEYLQNTTYSASQNNLLKGISISNEENDTIASICNGYLLCTTSVTFGEILKYNLINLEWESLEHIQDMRYVCHGQLEGTILDIYIQHTFGNAFRIESIECRRAGAATQDTIVLSMEEGATLIANLVNQTPGFSTDARQAYVLEEVLIGNWERPNGSILPITSNSINNIPYRIGHSTLDTLHFTADPFGENGDPVYYIAEFAQNMNEMNLYYLDDDDTYTYLGLYTRTNAVTEEQAAALQSFFGTWANSSGEFVITQAELANQAYTMESIHINDGNSIMIIFLYDENGVDSIRLMLSLYENGNMLDIASEALYGGFSGTESYVRVS